MRDAWLNPGVRRILLAAAISQIGDWSARLAIAFVVLDKTGLASGVGVAGALFFLPWLGPGQYLASFGDRMNRVRLLVRCELGRALLFAVIAIGAGRISVWLLLSMVAVVALIDPVWESNKAALIIDVTTDEQYPGAVKAVHSVNQAATLVGWAIGGFLIAWLGSGGALGVNAATFAMSAALIGGIDSSGQAMFDRGVGSFTATRDFFVNDRLSAVAVATAAGMSLFAMAVETQAPVYGRFLDLSERWIGVMIAVIPLVTLLAALAVPTKFSDRRLLGWAFSGGGVAALLAAVAFAAGETFWLALVGYAGIGAAFGSSLAANVAVGRRIPDTMRASIFSVIQGAIFIALSGGALVGGVVSDVAGEVRANVILALATGITGVIGAQWSFRHIERNDSENGQKTYPNRLV